MELKKGWIESKAKENIGRNFVKTVLGLSGYSVMDFGIENHNQEIIKQIMTNYVSETNRRLLSMPDFVVIDDKTKETWIVEVKYRTCKEFNMKNSNIAIKYRHMKDYLDFWNDATLILVLNVSPYCLCVDFNKINWNIHFKEKFENAEGRLDELWNFYGIYQIINNKFPKVTKENFNKTLTLLGMGNNNRSLK